ncbi:MAG: prenyltransferase [Bacteroides sp.]
MNKISFWLNNARKTALPQSMLPAVLAVCMAFGTDEFEWTPALLSVLGVLLAHLGMNLFDDYFDFLKKGTGIRTELDNAGIRARLAKCDYLLSGKVNIKQLRTVALGLCLSALTLGLIITLYQGLNTLWFMLIAGFLGISYSGLPFRFSYHGGGELLVGILFGPLLMGGVYFASCGTLTPGIWLVSVPVGMLVANILFSHSIMDYEPDKRIHKMTLAVIMNGNRTAMLTASGLFTFVPFIFIGFGVWNGYLPLSYLIVLLTLPMAVSLFYLLYRYVRNPKDSFSPRWWMGPMENWGRIQQAGIDWFMIRWLLSRNLLSFFCLLLLIVSFF